MTQPRPNHTSVIMSVKVTLISGRKKKLKSLTAIWQNTKKVQFGVFFYEFSCALHKPILWHNYDHIPDRGTFLLPILRKK